MTDLEQAIIRRQPKNVEFGFYTDAEIRTHSVLEITNHLAYDSLKTPLPSGLYDPRLGPTERIGSCVTCGNPSQFCPGHAGHIELCVPVYHPLAFPFLMKLLKCKCLNCHGLRLSREKCLLYEGKLKLVEAGKMKDAVDLDLAWASAVKSGESNIERFLAAKLAGVSDGLTKGGTTTTTTTLTGHERNYKRSIVKEFLAEAGAAKACTACNAYSPRLRHDGFNKIFQSGLSQKMTLANLASRIRIRPASSHKETDETNGGVGEKMAADDGGSGWRSDDSDDDEANGKTSSKGGGWRDQLSDKIRSEQRPGTHVDDDNGSESDKDELTRSKVTVSSSSTEKKSDKFMHALEVEAQVRLTWRRHPYLCSRVWGTAHCRNDKLQDGYSVFFMRVVHVPPSRFRPPMCVGDMSVEHPQNTYLSQIIKDNNNVREQFGFISKIQDDLKRSDNVDQHEVLCQDRDKLQAYAISSWIKLQTQVNCFMDNSKDPVGYGDAPLGIKQLLEKKEGLFRKFMMGKRVDYACRSVISPDPYIGTNEIGLPLYFAKTLTYPTPVTPLNVRDMRNLVIRGAESYPGANWVQDADGRRYQLSKMNQLKREALAARLLSSGGLMTVGRQLRNGDSVLMNRQPTLHKPGIMAHSVRVLHSPTQKTIRMHYANCNTYNADYDGDEMNCHFPQNDLARAEAREIMSTDFQYIVPTDGSPLRGLIQDHVDGGVLLTKVDTFLEKWEYQQLLFASLASLPGLELIASDVDIVMMPPAIRKPRELWTGKQVISTLLMHLKGDLPGISVERKTKTPANAFGEEWMEHKVLIRNGELLRGVLDKAAFGATDFSLVHGVYEAYGGRKAGLLLNALGRLFTAYIQYFAGHSCRMEDLILTPQADDDRRALVTAAYNRGSQAAKAWAESEGGKVPINPDHKDTPLRPVEVAATRSRIAQLLSGKDGTVNAKNYDAYMQSQLNPLASQIIKGCLPHGLAVLFPKNTFSLMVSTGAKGSTVNQSQVSCGLGQQALEGRRVPRMSSGRTLPSFAPYDPDPRADGFITDRFLTGIRPQEYYFHCMAGREGLVDTAVKTSRSGYLQRCLVKHLEELKVCYDFTVRDAEGSVIQFLYGEDGIDPMKAAHLGGEGDTFDYIARNYEALERQYLPLPGSRIDVAAEQAKMAETVAAASKEEDIRPYLKIGAFVKARKLRHGHEWERSALCQGWYSATITKVHSDGTFDIKYSKDKSIARHVPLTVDSFRTGSTLSSGASCRLLTLAAPDPVLQSPSLGQSGHCVSERVASLTRKALASSSLQETLKSVSLSPSAFASLMAAKYSSSLAAPGDAVGCVAAQGIGEPSTQMTLNTFHLAGSGANVTLGIPRLREIIMTASRTPKTPTMSVPVQSTLTDRRATKLARQFARLAVKELLASQKGVTVKEGVRRGPGGNWERAYYITLRLHPAERIREAFGLELEDVASAVTRKLIPRISYLMKAASRKTSDNGRSVEVLGGQKSDFLVQGSSSRKKKDLGNDFEEDDDNDDNDNNDFGEEDGINALRANNRAMVSYGDIDEDDAQIIKEQNHDNDDDSFLSTSTSSSSPPKNATAETRVVTDDEDNDESDDNVSAEIEKFYRSASANAVKIIHSKNTIVLQPLRVDPSARSLLMVELVEQAAETTIVKSRQGIQEAYINEEEGRGRCLQTLGSNFQEIWKLGQDVVDHSALMSNDIWAVRQTYGVEAAARNIGEQIRSVFAVYGISVDPRHLSLIGDYMTYDGGFKPMNRGGMGDGSSPFLKMSFETTGVFLTESALRNDQEVLASPSANITMGRPIRHGTGAFECIVKAS